MLQEVLRDGAGSGADLPVGLEAGEELSLQCPGPLREMEQVWGGRWLAAQGGGCQKELVEAL